MLHDSKVPEMSDVVRCIVDEMLFNVNVCLPAKIVTYYPKTQTADVQIQLLKKYSDMTTEPHPVLPGVPVKHPRANAGAAFIHMPLVNGDDVLLVFSQRSLDNWKQTGGMSDPDDYRKHDFSDAFALVGGSAPAVPFSVSDTNAIMIVNGTSVLKVNANGTFVATNGSNELVNLLVQLATNLQTLSQTLSTDTVNTIFGPTPLNSFSEYSTLATQFQTLVNELTTLKGS